MYTRERERCFRLPYKESFSIPNLHYHYHHHLIPHSRPPLALPHLESTTNLPRTSTPRFCGPITKAPTSQILHAESSSHSSCTLSIAPDPRPPNSPTNQSRPLAHRSFQQIIILDCQASLLIGCCAPCKQNPSTGPSRPSVHRRQSARKKRRRARLLGNLYRRCDEDGHDARVEREQFRVVLGGNRKRMRL